MRTSAVASAVLLSFGLFASAASAGGVKSLLGTVGNVVNDVTSTVSSTAGDVTGSGSGSSSGSSGGLNVNVSADLNVGGSGSSGSGGVGDLLHDTTTTVGNVLDGTTNTVNDVLDTTTATVNGALGTTTNTVNGVVGTTTDVLGNVLATAVNTANGVDGKVVTTVNKVLGGGGTLNDVLAELLADGHVISIEELVGLVENFGHYVSLGTSTTTTTTATVGTHQLKLNKAIRVSTAGKSLDGLTGADGISSDLLDLGSADNKLGELLAMLKAEDWTLYASGNSVCLPKSSVTHIESWLPKSDYSGFTRIVGSHAAEIAGLQHELAACHAGSAGGADEVLSQAEIKRVVGFDFDAEGKGTLYML